MINATMLANCANKTYLDVHDSIANSAVIGYPMLSFTNEECKLNVSFYFDNHYLYVDYYGDDKALGEQYLDYWVNVCDPVIMDATNKFEYSPNFEGCACQREADCNYVDKEYFDTACSVIMEQLSSCHKAVEESEAE